MTYDQPYRISPRKLLTRGDAVRLEGRRGLFRFVGADEAGRNASVIGPVSEAARAPAPLERIVSVTALRSAGRVPPERVAMRRDMAALSASVKVRRRR